MPANVGEMFYTGDVPWHGLGLALARPAHLAEALKAGGLNWQVDEVDLLTADDPPSPVNRRKAIVRTDRPPGDEKRVLGVAHRGFRPIQNHDAAVLFDAIFGQGRPVYHTGGYLGSGEVVWLLAKIDRVLRIAGDDVVQPYALMANSHDGSLAFNIRLTTVRVVCQNTLSMALRERSGIDFRRPHQGSLKDHAAAAQNFFAATIRELDGIARSFTMLAERRCNDETFEQMLLALIPDPRKPRNADRNPGVKRAWEKRVEAARASRAKIGDLRINGKGQELAGSRGTLWGALNAVLEYVDHHQVDLSSKLAYGLLGQGMDLKIKAFRLAQDEARNAA